MDDLEQNQDDKCPQDETDQRQYFAHEEHQGGLGVGLGVLQKQEHYGVEYVMGHVSIQGDGLQIDL